jgi:hypothetical protein
MSASIRLLRETGLFVFHLFIALMGTAVVESSIFPLIRGDTPRMFLFQANLLNASIAFAWGYFVYWRWQTAPAKWIWVAGLLWFGQRLLLHAKYGSMVWEMSGIGCAEDHDPSACESFLVYTLLALRVVSYSAGALSCLNLGKGYRRLSQRAKRSRRLSRKKSDTVIQGIPRITGAALECALHCAFRVGPRESEWAFCPDHE